MGNIQIFNPVFNQRVKQKSINLMGRIHLKPLPTGLGIYLNNFLLRRVRPNQNGAFELRIDLSELTEGDHQIEIRAITGHSTERAFVTFRMVSEQDSEEAEPQVSDNPPTDEPPPDPSS